MQTKENFVGPGDVLFIKNSYYLVLKRYVGQVDVVQQDGYVIKRMFNGSYPIHKDFLVPKTKQMVWVPGRHNPVPVWEATWEMDSFVRVCGCSCNQFMCSCGCNVSKSCNAPGDISGKVKCAGGCKKRYGGWFVCGDDDILAKAKLFTGENFGKMDDYFGSGGGGGGPPIAKPCKKRHFVVEPCLVRYNKVTGVLFHVDDVPGASSDCRYYIKFDKHTADPGWTFSPYYVTNNYSKIEEISERELQRHLPLPLPANVVKEMSRVKYDKIDQRATPKKQKIQVLGVPDGEECMLLDTDILTMSWTKWYGTDGSDDRKRYGGWKSERCTCNEKDIRPPLNFISMMHRFYEAETVLAHLQCTNPSPDGYDGALVSKLEGSLKEDARVLERTWLIYLMRAMAGELRHYKNHNGSIISSKIVGACRDAIQDPSGWIGNARLSPCPICMPIEALVYARSAYHAFYNDGHGWGDSSFGGKKWAGVAEAVACRLLRHVENHTFSLSDGTSWHLPHVQWYVQQKGVKKSLACQLKAKIKELGVPVPLEEYTGKMFRNEIIWIDYCADLEHNGGCVLGKGYVPVQRSHFKRFLDFKRKSSLLNCPKFFPVECERVRTRLGTWTKHESKNWDEMYKAIHLKY